MSNPFLTIIPSDNVDKSMVDQNLEQGKSVNGEDISNHPYSPIAGFENLKFRAPWADNPNRTKEMQDAIILQRATDTLRAIPGVGSAISSFENSVNGAISAFQSAMNNPMGLLSDALNAIKFRRVINRYFEGLFPFRRGKFSPIPFSTSYLDKSEYIHDWKEGTTRSIKDYNSELWKPLYLETTIQSVNDSQSQIVEHKGHGYDNRGDFSSEPSDGISIDNFPCYGSLNNFFKTTIGTHFYWGIKLESLGGHPNLPPPLFCDSSDKDAKDLGEAGNKWFGGWLPATSYSLNEYTQDSEELTNNAYTLPLITGFKYGNTITTNVIEVSDLTARRWLEEYRKFMCPSPKIVRPYKECTYKMTIYTYMPSGKKVIEERTFIVIPNYDISISGENQMNTQEAIINWTIVGYIESEQSKE